MCYMSYIICLISYVLYHMSYIRLSWCTNLVHRQTGKMQMRMIIITQFARVAMLHCTIKVREPRWCWGAEVSAYLPICQWVLTNSMHQVGAWGLLLQCNTPLGSRCGGGRWPRARLTVLQLSIFFYCRYREVLRETAEAIHPLINQYVSEVLRDEGETCQFFS